ncbi:MAG: adenylate/guanylate cyclase domain-containing protein [Thalassobaculales bacterium]
MADNAAEGLLIDQLADWLMGEALDGGSALTEVLDGCCQRLRAAGVPVTRAYLSFRTLHPLFSAMALTWRNGAAVEVDRFGSGPDSPRLSAAFRASPHHSMLLHKLPLLRRRLAGRDAMLDYPILKDLADQGATDYLAFLIGFNPKRDDGVLGSWTTDRPGGFTDGELRALQRVQRRLAVACKVSIREQIIENVAGAYLGPDAGARVLDGQIKRGDGRSISAALLYSDLRDSTQFADRLPPVAYLALLNSYFECTAGAVIDGGGEVLALSGDGVLGVFEIGPGGPAAACAAALAAAGSAQQRLAALNAQRRAEGAEALAFGIGLHVGEVLHGNIGVPQRLNFTVVGVAVNEAQRLEALTRSLERPVLATAAFSAHLPDHRWRPLGAHVLRGVAAPVDILAPEPS